MTPADPMACEGPEAVSMSFGPAGSSYKGGTLIGRKLPHRSRRPSGRGLREAATSRARVPLSRDLTLSAVARRAFAAARHGPLDVLLASGPTLRLDWGKRQATGRPGGAQNTRHSRSAVRSSP